MLFAPLMLSLAAAGAPDVSARGLAELTNNGEVLLLPRHHREAFDGWLFTHSTETCDAIEKGMLEVEKWPERFSNVASVKPERGGTAANPSVSYEMELNVTFSPTIYGRITRVAPRVMRFNDGVTKAYSVFTLADADDGSCALAYRIVEDPTQSSGWVAVMEGLEATAGDAGNYAAGISTTRGYARPETRKKLTRGRAGDDALATLAGRGTVVIVDRRTAKLPTYTLRRRVDAAFSDVAWAIRNKKGYPEKSGAMKKAVDGGKKATYTIGGFGGRVGVETDVKDTVDDNGVLVVDEAVSGGDLAAGAGGWRWTVIPVDGGVDVELVMNVDLVKGSRLLTTMSDADPIARESFMLHIALSLMGDLIPGKPLASRPQTIARETPAEPTPTSATETTTTTPGTTADVKPTP